MLVLNGFLQCLEVLSKRLDFLPIFRGTVALALEGRVSMTPGLVELHLGDNVCVSCGIVSGLEAGQNCYRIVDVGDNSFRCGWCRIANPSSYLESKISHDCIG